MDHISSLLPRVLKKRGLHGQALASLAVHHAQAWLASHLPEHAGVLLVKKLSDGTLHISAENSIAAQECSFRSEELKRFLQRECETTITEVRIVRGR